MDWKKIVGTVAPTIATALGGPLAGTAVKFLGDQFLGNENATEEELAQFVKTADPDTLLKLKQADHEFELQMQKLGVDVFQIEADDKKDARVQHKNSYMPSVLAVTLTFIIAGIVGLLFYVEVPPGAENVLYMLLGVVVKEWGGAMQYYYGTTHSSQEKTKMMK